MVACEAGADHCCYLGPFGVCPALRDDGPGAARRWVCTIREAEGSWAAVHVAKAYRRSGIADIVNDLVGVDCGDWPRPGETCHTCGVIG